MLYKALEMIECMSEKQLLFTFRLLKCYSMKLSGCKCESGSLCLAFSCWFTFL